MSALMFTCPHCRTVVDYSCMCPTTPPIRELVGHETVDDAKKHIEAMTLPALPSRNPFSYEVI